MHFAFISVVLSASSVVLCFQYQEKLAFPVIITHPKRLVEVEKYWTSLIQESVQDQKDSLHLLLRHQQKSSQIVPNVKDKEKYLENPLNCFALVHRLVKIWPLTISLMETGFGSSLKKPKMLVQEVLPHYLLRPGMLSLISVNTEELWKSALTALIRLQETYDLNTESIANGVMQGTFSGTHLTADACLDLGVHYYHLRHPERSIQWLQQALRRAGSDSEVYKVTAMEYLYMAYCYKGNLRRSNYVFKYLLQNYRSFRPSPSLLTDYQLISESSCQNLARVTMKNLYSKEEDVHNVKVQKGLCRPENHRYPSDRRLRCRLVHYGQPHLKIRPFKLEELHIDPPLLIFHNVMHDGEKQQLIMTYYNMTKPAESDYNGMYVSHQDTQYNTYLPQQLTPDSLEEKLNVRAAWIANVHLEHSTDPMLANYGLAAEIKSHVDLGYDDKILNDLSRSDYISLMFWVNDVIEGGYTIFPLINVAVAPVKGAALFWFNRFPNWEESEMDHSGCPVLRGTKWILTKWFHVKGQDFPKCRPGKEKSYKYFYLDTE